MKKAIVQQLHLNSTRIPKKLLQKVNGLTLLDRGLAYMRYLRDETDCRAYVSCSLEDKEIVDACKKFGIDLIPANKEDLDTDTWPDCTHYLFNYLLGLDLVWHSNIMCHPFLKIETGLSILQINEPCVLSFQRRGTIWNSNFDPVIGPEMADTRHNQIFYETSHIGYIIRPEWYTQSDKLVAQSCLPHQIKLSAIERLDIDTPDDLLIAQNIQIDNTPKLFSLDA